ncbi:MAG: HD domain-containing protein [Alistipes sp.]|nr:HD domain-containing protein [Alistipes sp.]MBR2628217.1 HD domain-containing protein [Alistipes sp.]
MVRKEIRDYIEQHILPRYETFDAAHRTDHATTVIERSMKLAQHYEVNEEMAYVVAAYHDIGLEFGREMHHRESARLVMEDKELCRWFSVEQRTTIAEAAEDHRASAKCEPRSIYGRIVAEADRAIEPISIVRRTVQYGLAHYPHLAKEEHWLRTVEHLEEKYAEGGYLKLWIAESDNATKLEELRAIIKDKARLREIFELIFEQESI